ncbi:hypothetical protein [Streptomyces sp. CNZ287]|uniref:hypothetical protein n=1 Tax=Streptomyces sp. B22F1 TaxID=3153566 RepID=UPI00119C6EE2
MTDGDGRPGLSGRTAGRHRTKLEQHRRHSRGRAAVVAGSGPPLRLGAPVAVPHPPVLLWEAVPPREPGGHAAPYAPSGSYAAGPARRFAADRLWMRRLLRRAPDAGRHR